MKSGNFWVGVTKKEELINLKNFFSGLVVRVDQELIAGKFFMSPNGKFSLPQPEDFFFRPTKEGWSKDVPSLNRDQVCAILKYLGSAEGWRLLEIPDDQDEIEFVLGKIKIGLEEFFIRVEHELELGKKEEVHIHVRSTENFREKIKPNLFFLEAIN